MNESVVGTMDNTRFNYYGVDRTLPSTRWSTRVGCVGGWVNSKSKLFYFAVSETAIPLAIPSKLRHERRTETVLE